MQCEYDDSRYISQSNTHARLHTYTYTYTLYIYIYIYIYIYVCVCVEIVVKWLLLKMNTVTQDQIPNEAVHTSLSANQN